MIQRSYKAFVARGFDTDLIKKIGDVGLTLTGLKGQNLESLRHVGFSPSEAKMILSKVNRKPIPKDVIDEIVRESGGVCCYCADGNNTKPYQIHHITEYYITQDNSEANLMLVCPTHHVTIHNNKVSIDDQLSTKRSWKNIWQIAKQYAKVGINFPFGAFYPMDYKRPGSITEIFLFNAPSPSVCLELLDESLKNEIMPTLQKHNKLIISGLSGSGKTTLAQAIAGVDSNFLAFSYSIPRSSINPVSEILLFLSQCIRPIILIIDNANALLTESQIEQILRATSPDKRILIVHTKTTSLDQNDIENHFPDAYYYIKWQFINPSIINLLVSYEAEVLRYMKENESALEDEVGSGVHQRTLRSLLENYARDVDTVWQFLYLLSAGFNRIHTTWQRLYSEERMDLVVLAICIKQISKVENGVSLEEAYDIYNQHQALNNTAPPQIEWLKDKLEELVHRRLIKCERGRYNTIHRQFAIKLLEHAYFVKKSDTEVLLNRVFNDLNSVSEIVILWSWLQHTAARTYIKSWSRSLTERDWSRLVQAAVIENISILSLLADKMSMLTHTMYVPMDKCYEPIAVEVVELVNKLEKHTLYHLRRLFVAVESSAPEMIKQVLYLIPNNKFCEIIAESEPAEFDSINWLFVAINNVCPEWVSEIGSHIRTADLDNVIDKIVKGDVDSLIDILEFEHRYVNQAITRSRYRYYTKKMSFLLEQCHLEEIRFHATRYYRGVLLPLHFFDNDIKEILHSLNTQQISRDFEIAPPRCWSKMLTISLLGSNIHADTSRKIVNGISVEKLIKNILRYPEQHHWELRVLIYQLCYGSNNKKNEFATTLFDIVHRIVAKNRTDQNDVLKAYYRLSPDLANEIYFEFQIPVPDVNEDISSPDSFLETRNKIKKMEEKGEDYIVFDE